MKINEIDRNIKDNVRIVKDFILSLSKRKGEGFYID